MRVRMLICLHLAQLKWLCGSACMCAGVAGNVCLWLTHGCACVRCSCHAAGAACWDRTARTQAR